MAGETDRLLNRKHRPEHDHAGRNVRCPKDALFARSVSIMRSNKELDHFQPPLRLTYHPDCQRKLVTGALPPRAAADGPDCRRAMTEMESRNQRRLVLYQRP